MPPAISVIVSNFNGEKFLPRLLETLHAQRDVSLELIVVDRHSRDSSAAILAAHPDVRVVSETPTSGLVSGYAAGAEVARHELLFFCNEDMWFEPDCLALLASHFSAPDVAAADPGQWTYDGATLLRAATRFVPTRWEQNSADPRRRPDFLVPMPPGSVVPFACAGALMIRRDVYNDVGGWDRTFFLDGEDVDLFIRVRQAGWKVVVEPRSKVYHAVNTSNAKLLPGQVPVSRRRYESARSTVLILAVKYLPLRSCLLVGGLWAASVLSRLVRVRFPQAAWDLGALREFFRRFPGAWAYRRSHRDVNRRRPVLEKFFRADEFQR